MNETPSVSHSLDSSLKEGASGEEGKFPGLPKPPSMREVASRSDDGRSLPYCFALMDFISPPAEMIS